VFLRAAFFLASIVIAGCGGTQQRTATESGNALDPQRLYPLKPNAAWSYDVDLGGGQTTLAVSRVDAVSGTQTRVEVAGRNHNYQMRPEGIWRVDHGVWLLKRPIAVGANWPTLKSGTAKVISVNRKISTMAGTFTGCVVIEEEAATFSIRTTYCPDVGPVELVSLDRTKPQTTPVVAKLRGFDLQGGGE